MSSRIEERQQDEETMDNLDFEEISDEELDPEESKTGKSNIKILILGKKSLGFLFFVFVFIYSEFKHNGIFVMILGLGAGAVPSSALFSYILGKDGCDYD